MKNSNQQVFSGMTSKKDKNEVCTITISKKRAIVPIVFLPGVMGSNLKVKNGTYKSNPIWRLDSMVSPLGWFVHGYGGPKARKLELDPNETLVDDQGLVLDAANKELEKIKDKYTTPLYDARYNSLKQQELLHSFSNERKEAIEANLENHLFGTRQERGWGTAAYISYGEFLEKLQESLFDPKGCKLPALEKLLNGPQFQLDNDSKKKLIFEDKQIQHCNAFYFPVHVMGYNWLESNVDSAKALQKLIEETLPNYYKKRNQAVDKVILITHSMGGLVARYYTEVLGGADKVYGVIHGVQPSTGAVAAYTRMKRGTEVNSNEHDNVIIDNIANYVTEHVLGKNAAEMTAVCAQSPGPLQLLPTKKYGTGEKGWLIINQHDGEKKCYPEKDPYKDIYLAKDKWWCVCEPHLINPFNEKQDEEIMNKDWAAYESIIKKKVQLFHSKIEDKFHPNTYAFFGISDKPNIPPKFSTYQKAHWIGHFTVGYEHQMKKTATVHVGDENRLDLTELSELRTIKTSCNEWVPAKYKINYDTFNTKRGNINEIYKLQPADGNGDGTVPQSSGEIPIESLQARLHLPIEHEGAYKNELSQEFTLRAIVDIMWEVKVND